jgi:hypothetical protein
MAAMSKRRKKRRKKTGFTIHTPSDRAPHRAYHLEIERGKPQLPASARARTRTPQRMLASDCAQNLLPLALQATLDCD